MVAHERLLVAAGGIGALGVASYLLSRGSGGALEQGARQPAPEPPAAAETAAAASSAKAAELKRRPSWEVKFKGAEGSKDQAVMETIRRTVSDSLTPKPAKPKVHPRYRRHLTDSGKGELLEKIEKE